MSLQPHPVSYQAYFNFDSWEVQVSKWNANSGNSDLTKYRIYKIQPWRKFNYIDEVTADVFIYNVRNTTQGLQYTFAVTAVNSQNIEGAPAFITIEWFKMKKAIYIFFLFFLISVLGFSFQGGCYFDFSSSLGIKLSTQYTYAQADEGVVKADIGGIGIKAGLVYRFDF